MNRPPTQSRNITRQNSQPFIKPITPQNNYRINNYNLFSLKKRENKNSNTYFEQTTNYSKNDKPDQYYGGAGKNYKQFYFEKEDQEEEISFQSLCIAMNKLI